MKKVALDLQPCYGNQSGIGTYTYEISRRLSRQGELEFCGTLFARSGDRSVQGLQMPVHRFGGFPYGVYRRIWHLLPLPYSRLFPIDADLSIFFDYIVPPGVKGHVVTTIHDMTYLRCPETMARRNLRRISRDIGRSVQRSDRVITVSEFSKREIMELLGVPEEKIAVIPCAPRFSDAMADFDPTAERLGIRRPYLLYVGNIEPRKNILRLIRAFALLKQQGLPHQLVLAGKTGWGCEEVLSASAPLKESGDLVFTGYISDGEKNTLYRHAAAFVMPSLYEGFGIPPLEAMKQDCPVVCSRAASLPEVVGAAAQLVDPLDENDIANGIRAVLSDEALRTGLIAAGREQVKNFSWDASVQNLIDLCNDILKGADDL